MKLHLLAFGIARDILNGSSIEFELHAGNRISDLKQALQDRHPGFNQLTSLSFAVNESYVPDTHQLQDGDEVVLIPPVSGG